MYLLNCLFLILGLYNIMYAQQIVTLTNRPDPFGPLPDTTTNYITISANDDMVDMIYTTTTPPYRVRHLFNARTTSLNQIHVWNGQDDNSNNCSPGTYEARIKIGRNVIYSTKIPSVKNFIDFYTPMDIACDKYGNIYVIDNRLCIVEKFSPTGVLLLKFGSEGTGNGQFTNPRGIAVDTNGFIYVTDDLGGTGRVQKFKPDGSYSNSFTSTTYRDPQGMGYDPNINRIYFVDTASDDIIRLNPDTMTIDDVNTSLANVNPTDIAIDPSDSDIYVVTGGNRVRRWSRTRFENNLTQNNSWLVGAQNWWGITIRSNFFYIVSRTSHIIQQRDKNTGALIESSGSLGSGTGQFNTPYSIAWDSLNDFLWVTDSGNKRIQKIEDSGNMTNTDSIEADKRGLINPADIALDADGNLYVADNGHYCVKKFDRFGNFLMEIGEYGTGPGQFQDIRGVAVDKYGYIYVSDYQNDNIQKFAPNGTFVTQWNVIDPQGLYCWNGTNIMYIRNRTANPSARENRMIRMDLNGVILQDFQLSFNDVSYYDLSRDSRGYTYCVGGWYIDRYPPNASGNTTPTWVGVGARPQGVAIDEYDTIWVTRSVNDGRAYSRDLNSLYQFGSAGSGDGQFDNPRNVAVVNLNLPDEWADIWIIDSGNNRVQKFIISWADETNEYITIANPGAPFVTSAFPDENSSTNVRNINGTRYVRAGKTVFKIYFSQQMNTNIKPFVKFIFNSQDYIISEESYINNVWTGTAYISTNMGEGIATLYISGAQNTSGSNMTPDPDTSFTFIIDTIPPQPPYVEQPPSPTTFTQIIVNGTTEAEIRVHILNYSSASNGVLISSHSNILSDQNGNFSGAIDLLTPKPSSNYITAIAVDKAGNISKEFYPRRTVKCINSGGGTGYVYPTDDKYVGEPGKPNLKFNWTADSEMQNATVIIEIPYGWALPSTNYGSAGYVYISDSYGITFAGTPTNLQVKSNKIKVCFSYAYPGGYFEITYGTNNKTMVSNFAGIGQNDFIMRSTNNDPGFKTNWNLPWLVYPAAGHQLYINVLSLPLQCSYTSLLPSQLYNGQSDVPAFELFFTNANQYHNDEIQKIVLSVFDTNLNPVVPSHVISKVALYTNNSLFFVDNLIENYGNEINIDLSSSPLLVPALSSKNLSIKIDIINFPQIDNLKIGIENSNSFLVKDKDTQTEVEIKATNTTFPFRTSNAIIISNSPATNMYTLYTNLMPYFVDTSQKDVVVVGYTFHNTNSTVNEIEILSMQLKIEDINNNGIVPANIIRTVTVKDASNSTVYLVDSTIENTGDTVFLDLAGKGLTIPPAGKRSINVLFDITSTPSAVNFKVNLPVATNVKARDKIFYSPVSNYPYAGYSFPMRTGYAEIADHFQIYHQTNTYVNQWSPVTIKVLNISNKIVTNYNGIITLDSDGNSLTIEWTNNYLTYGIFSNFGAGDDKCKYKFSILDKGVITLSVIDSTEESINITAIDGWITDQDVEGYLHFLGMPKIEITKIVSKTNVKPYDIVTYTIIYTNTSNIAADSFEIVESLPAETIYLTNSAEVSNSPHAGNVIVYYATNYTNYIWLTNTFDSNTGNGMKIKKIKWVFDTSLTGGGKGILKFKVIIR